MGPRNSTTSEEWRRIEELFFACEPLDEKARARMLEERCGEHPALRERVERLLTAAGSVGDRLEEVVQAARAELGAHPTTDVDPGSDASRGSEGEQVGPYRLLGVLGEGGMGTVHLAERADGTYEQRVAVKVVKQGLAGHQVERRFRRERQILARLEHPAVSRLLDGGSTPAGQPYLVMELVDGEPIDAYCDRHCLSIDARLELFRRVCAGVQKAHRNLIVHRDLKPSNILVTAEGQPKLLDFGISKLLEGDEPVDRTELTSLGQRVLTPEYASPEQLRDEPITTAVDVYALGLLLHRLLTGDRPYPLPATRGEALRKAICDVPAEHPSSTVARLLADDPRAAEAIATARATDPVRLRKRLAGDLDHIVAKTLRKEPDQRYASVEWLSADLGRHLEGLPVEARRGGWRYLAGRFLRRNRVVVAAGLSILLALALGLVGQTREARRANREAARANSEARASAEVADFLVELFDAADPAKTREELTARQLLDRGVERIHGELADQPLTQARLMSTLGRVYHNRGHPEAEGLFATSLELRLAALPDDHPLIATGHLDLADNLRVQGRVEEAMPHYERALALRREHFGDDSIEHAQVLNNMALALIRSAEYRRAEESLRRALEIRRRHLGEHMLVAQSLHNLTLIATDLGDYAAAAARGREALDLKTRLLPADDPSLARTYFELSFPVQKLGDYDEAERLISTALEIARNAWGGTHVDVLMMRGDLAYLRHLQGEREAAESSQREILELKRTHLGEDHREVAFSLHSLGRQLADRGDLEGAEEVFRRSLGLRSRIYAADHPNVATAKQHLGALLLQRGQIEDAEPLLLSSLESRRRALPPTHPTLADSLLPVAELLLEKGSTERATKLAGEGLEILRAALPPDHPRIARARAVLDACSRSGQES